MHQDIITALDESRINEPKLVYKYKENDLEETKSLDEAVEVIKKQDYREGEHPPCGHDRRAVRTQAQSQGGE